MMQQFLLAAFLISSIDNCMVKGGNNLLPLHSVTLKLAALTDYVDKFTGYGERG